MEPKNIGVILYLPAQDTLLYRFIADWSKITVDPDDQEYLALWSCDLVQWVGELGAGAFLTMLEGTLSNALQISDRITVTDGGYPERQLETLFNVYVASEVEFSRVQTSTS